MLFNLHAFVTILFFLLLLILVSDHWKWGKIPSMISIFLNLLTLILWPKVGSTLENGPHALVKNILCYCSVRRALSTSAGLTCLQCCSHPLLLIFCLDILPIIENGTLKYSTVIVVLFVSPFNSLLASYISEFWCLVHSCL